MNESTAAQGMLATIARMRREILADIERGIVPTTVRSFSELHAYVDANEYGGFCSDAPASMADAEAAQNAVNEWLAAGRPDGIKRIVRISRSAVSVYESGSIRHAVCHGTYKTIRDAKAAHPDAVKDGR